MNNTNVHLKDQLLSASKVTKEANERVDAGEKMLSEMEVTH